MTIRKNSYDLLRILATVAVITIHVSANYIIAITDSGWFGTLYSENFFATSLFNLWSRFAVPAFIMLSGALALDNPQNKDYKNYYKKTFINIGVGTLIFSALYFLYGLMMGFASNVRQGSFSYEFVLGGGTSNLLIGKPFAHMWYLYMMAGVFFLVPWIIRIREEVGNKIFDKFAIVFFITSTIGLYTSTHELMWDPGLSYGYLGYFMMGFVIKKNFKEEKGWKPLALILVGFLILTIVAYFRFLQGTKGIADSDIKYTLVEPSSPIIAVASILIFIGFTKLHFNVDLTRISKLCFEIYLVHAGIWNILLRFVTLEMDNRVVIPVMVVVVFILSLLFAVMWKKIMKKLLKLE